MGLIVTATAGFVGSMAGAVPHAATVKASGAYSAQALCAICIIDAAN